MTVQSGKPWYREPWPWILMSGPAAVLVAGAATIWNITSASLAQALVPNELLGRVSTFAKVLAWGAIPVSALLGGVLIQWTRNVALIYALLGALTFVVTFAFLFTPLGRAKHYRAAGEAA